MEKFNNKGVATIEASLIMPLFIFSMLALYHMAQCILAENIIYDAAVETSEYLAQVAYVNEASVYGGELVFSNYIDDNDMVETYIKGGVKGISLWGTTGVDSEGYYELCISYEVVISLPFVPQLTKDKNIKIKRRAYVGDAVNADDDQGETDTYVYVTDNREVYHGSRLCTYLELSMHTVSLATAKSSGFTPCEYCGIVEQDRVIITEYGGRYHCRGDCSGLKRTVYRVKYSEVEGLGGCSRCVD